MGLFRRTETAPDRPRLLDDVLDELKYLRGRVESLEIEWRDTKDQVKRSYQRLEKAASRAEKASESPCDEKRPQAEQLDAIGPQAATSGFWDKWQRMSGS